MQRLGVNIDHVATIRQARRGRMPDPVEAALVCERAGAAQITCHLREDRRHVQDADLPRLLRAVAIPLNLEMAMAEEIVRVALRLRPAQVTLVPERRQELTTEGGLDVVRHATRLIPVIKRFHGRGVKVSLFIDPNPRQVRAAQRVGAKIVELHTGRYAEAKAAAARRRELATLASAARQGKALGLAIAAGHGLDYENVLEVGRIPEIEELNIGFSIIARSIFIGLEQAVRDMIGLLDASALR